MNIVGVSVALAGAAIAAGFAAKLSSHFAAKRRQHALAWSVALGLYAVGMVALAAGFAFGWSPATYGLYWLSGALLSVAFLATGQLHLIAPGKSALWWTLAGLAVVWTGSALLLTPYDSSVLAAASDAGSIPAGRDVFAGGLAYTILRPITLVGTVVVLGGCLWSGIRTRRFGVLLIALGVAVSATSSTFLRAGLDELVAVALTAGVAIIYAGYLATVRPPRENSPAARAAALSSDS
jgi:hypothetical protein